MVCSLRIFAILGETFENSIILLHEQSGSSDGRIFRMCIHDDKFNGEVGLKIKALQSATYNFPWKINLARAGP